MIRYLKGADILLGAGRRVRLAVPDVKIRLAGRLDWEPDYVARLRKDYADLFDSGVASFVGPLDARRMVEEYVGCSLLCLPSRAESAPMVIAEAMAVGRPVVASRLGGIPEMVEEGVTGFLCESENPEALAERLVCVLKDDGMRRAMGDRARQAAGRRYKADAVAGATLEAYRTVLGLHGGSEGQ